MIMFFFYPNRLSIVSPEVAVPYSSGTAAATAVEIYHCPPGYTGTSCEVSDPYSMFKKRGTHY